MRIALTLLLTLAACAGAAPSPDNSPPQPSPSASAAPSTAGSATPAIAHPSEPKLSPALNEATARLLALIETPSDAGIAGAFSPTFLAAVPATKVSQLLGSIHSDLGACTKFEALEVADETTGVVRIVCDRGNVNATMKVSAAAPHLFDGLLLKPAP